MKNGIIVFVEIVFNDFYFKMLASFPSRLVEHTLSLSIVRDFFVKNNERMNAQITKINIFNSFN